MTEEATEKDVKEQEVVETAEETTESTPASQKPEEGSKEFNFRKMEQKLSQLENQNYELMQEMQKAQASQKKEEPDELSQLQDDDLITFGQVSKYTEKLAEKKARELVEQEFQKREVAQQPTQVKAQFKDYDQVVTPDNIEKLIKEDPELEELIQKSRNPYVRAYKEVKKSNFFREKSANKESEEKLEENSKKPMSSNSLGSQRPLSQANSYSREELYAEMMQCGKGGY
ncbi:MAG: hypothetical protein ACE5GV_00355 [Candidatus Scalindua sp.]